MPEGSSHSADGAKRTHGCVRTARIGLWLNTTAMDAPQAANAIVDNLTDARITGRPLRDGRPAATSGR